jgi:rod shape-determining protein MreB
MKVQCPKCETAYQVADEKIPVKGAYVRCLKCQTRFIIKKESAQAAAPATAHESLSRETETRVCKNCGREIGNLEKAHTYNKHTVCHNCFEILLIQASADRNHQLKSSSLPEVQAENSEGDRQIKTEAPSDIKTSFSDLFSKDMAIDLGTVNTLIYMKRKGIVLNEPSVIALRTHNGNGRQVLAIGCEAKKMLGRVPANIIAVRPMRDGVIADFEAAGAMIRHFIKKVKNRLAFFKPRMIVAVPFGITPVEKRAVREALFQAGAREVFLIEEPMAAAIGGGLDVTQPKCSMVVDIGGGTTEVAVISLSGIVSSKSLKVAGDKMDVAIMRYIKKKYNFIIGERTAELIKTTIGNAQPETRNPEKTEVRGWDMVSEKPRIISINSEETRDAISEQLHDIAEAIKIVLDRTPQELTADVVENGMLLTGGVALLKNLDKFLRKETGLPIKVAENPLLTVALGSGMTLDNIELLKQVVIR